MIRRISLVSAFLFAAVIPAAAQTPIRERRSTDRVAPAGEPTAVRNRVVGDTRNSNHAVKETANEPPKASSAAIKQETPKPIWGNSVVPVSTHPIAKPSPARIMSAGVAAQTGNQNQPKLFKQTSLSLDNTAAAANSRAPVTASATVTAVYRVGIGDVLDIQLANVATRESTLFTVLKDGVVEYPLLPKPMIVTGLTTQEIARRLTAEIKVIQGARALVSVRDYASHAIVINGLVDNPGRKVLRREAMPLFAVLAESLPRPDATTATVLRNGKEIILSLSNSQDLATLVMSGDTIKISAMPKRFVYLGGDVASAGEKEFRDGMTLTQAVYAAGGPQDAKSKVRVARRNTNGFLATDEYNLHAISEGKVADPLLQPGDRIEVKRGVW